MRRHNLSAVLDRLHVGGPMTRSQLADLTGLNRSTIRDLLAELAQLGLVVEDRGTTGSGPGRPSSIARARPEGAVVLAVELEVDSMAVATVGLGGELFDSVRVANPPARRTPREVVDELARRGRPMLDALPPDHTLAGVGIAVAGVVRRHDGFVHVAPNLGWSNVPLKGMIAEQLGLDRVMMANEADLGALAEHRRGAAKGSRHLIYVAGEVGVGIGIIHDGKPMLGAAGYAGEAGHNVINPSGQQCRCGSVGCWETEVGEDALVRHAGLPASEPREGMIDEILRRAHAGDPRTFAALGEIGRWLGTGIGNLINTFNPDLVLIGGFFHQLYPFLEQSLHREAQATALAAPWLSCSIRRSEIGIDAALVGAAELVFAEVVGNPTAFGGPHPARHGAADLVTPSSA
ncbi:MAG TPA: ROK family transcriptional regulator [Acidimicrobiia bacterium]|nr:ROK family transcriptional regulator [Acidimicrobiia bacterium]